MSSFETRPWPPMSSLTIVLPSQTVVGAPGPAGEGARGWVAARLACRPAARGSPGSAGAAGALVSGAAGATRRMRGAGRRRCRRWPPLGVAGAVLRAALLRGSTTERECQRERTEALQRLAARCPVR